MKVFFQKIKKNQSGQSSVEYILMFAVIAALMTSVLRSDAFQNALGEDSQIFAALYGQMEYGYRHASIGSDDQTPPPPARSFDHHSYNRDGGARFFIPRTAYPQ